MKRFLITALITAATSFGIFAQDSEQWERLRQKLDEYTIAISIEPLDVQASETDFLIESCNDSSLRNHTALYLYKKYSESKLMGAENISIHIFDKWFSDGSLKMGSEEEFFLARMDADLNRASLIGCKAPILDAKDISGRNTTVFDAPDGKRDKILFFYYTGCAKCKVESILMRNMLEAEDFEADIITFCTGENKEAMMAFINENLCFDQSSKRKIIHLWDPDGISDFVRFYGVVQTPKIFLVGGDGVIVGRSLDTGSLAKLLEMRKPEEMEYGSAESEALFDKVFGNMEDTMGCGQLSQTADYIIQATEGTPKLRKQLLGDLLYYVAGKKKTSYKCGVAELVRKHYIGNTELWNTPEDSLKVLSLASFLNDMATRTPEGMELPKIKVHTTVLTHKWSKERLIDLSKQKSSILIFHTHGCKICEAEIASASAMVQDRQVRKIILIDMDLLFNVFPDEATLLLDAFDLSALPFTISTDSKGRLQSKYLLLQNQ
ncbi:MAG: peroxiredoxin family protein [Candidatus Cryptobacteroides sp.]